MFEILGNESLAWFTCYNLSRNTRAKKKHTWVLKSSWFCYLHCGWLVVFFFLILAQADTLCKWGCSFGFCADTSHGEHTPSVRLTAATSWPGVTHTRVGFYCLFCMLFAIIMYLGSMTVPLYHHYSTKKSMYPAWLPFPTTLSLLADVRYNASHTSCSMKHTCLNVSAVNLGMIRGMSWRAAAWIFCDCDIYVYIN